MSETSRPDGRLAPFAALLADGPFRRVWLTGCLVGVLRWLELLAIGVFAFQETRSAVIVSLMTALRMAPLFLFGVPMGALADRFERKLLLLLGLGILALSSAVLAWLAITDRLALWHVAIGVFLSGSFWAAEFPVRRTMLGELVPGEALGPAMALESSTSNATRMLGPALGGLLLEALGLGAVFALAALAYLAAIILVWPLVYRSAGGRSAVGVLAALREGFLAVGASRMIQAALAVTMIVNLWGFAYITLIPVIGERQLGLSATAIGLLASTEGLGALIGSVLVGIFATQRSYTRIYLYASLIFLLSLIAFGASTTAALSFALMLTAGMSIAGFAVTQSTITFLAAPPAIRSRIMGVLTVSIGTAPIGMLHVGLLADWLGAGQAIMVMAGEGVLALGLTAWLWPELRKAVLVAPQSADGATSSRATMPSSSRDGAG